MELCQSKRSTECEPRTEKVCREVPVHSCRVEGVVDCEDTPTTHTVQDDAYVMKADMQAVFDDVWNRRATSYLSIAFVLLKSVKALESKVPSPSIMHSSFRTLSNITYMSG